MRILPYCSMPAEFRAYDPEITEIVCLLRGVIQSVEPSVALLSCRAVGQHRNAAFRLQHRALRKHGRMVARASEFKRLFENPSEPPREGARPPSSG